MLGVMWDGVVWCSVESCWVVVGSFGVFAGWLWDLVGPRGVLWGLMGLCGLGKYDCLDLA